MIRHRAPNRLGCGRAKRVASRDSLPLRSLASSRFNRWNSRRRSESPPQVCGFRARRLPKPSLPRGLIADPVLESVAATLRDDGRKRREGRRSRDPWRPLLRPPHVPAAYSFAPGVAQPWGNGDAEAVGMPWVLGYGSARRVNARTFPAAWVRRTCATAWGGLVPWRLGSTRASP